MSNLDTSIENQDASSKEKDQLKKIHRWYRASVENERTWRCKARMWHDYYHGDQLSEDIMKLMRARKQPPLKFNLTKSIVNLLTGQEIQGRTDIKFVGFENSDTVPAELLTDLYRQKGEEDNFSYEVTRAFQDGVIGGRGNFYVDWDSEDNEIFREYIDWEEIFIDACSKRVDYKDAGHIFRAKWIDLDVAIEAWPDKEAELKKLVHSANIDENDNVNRTREKKDYFDDLIDDPKKWVDTDRERVKIIEGWYYFRNPETNKSEMYNCVFSDSIFIESPGPFGREHNQFPIVFTHYNRDRQGDPYGLVKDLVDPQDVINRSFSKSMHILGTRQVLAEKGALANVKKVQEEICKPDAVINDFEDGSLSSNKIRIEENRGDAQMAFQHFDIGVSAMHRVSGVNPELQGLHTNARSGTAISMRLRQGNTVLTSLYDCLEKTKKKAAEIYVYLMAQYMKNKEIMRYKLPNGQIAQAELNATTEEGIDQDGNVIKARVNELSEIFKYDIVITESAKSANANEATLNSLVEMTKVAPALQNNATFLAEIIKTTDLPNKDQLAQAVLPPPPGGDGQPTS